MGMRYNFPDHQGTPPGVLDDHPVRGSRSVRRQRVFAGVGVVLAVVLIVVSWLFAACTRATLSEPTTDIGANVDSAPGRIAFVSDRDGDAEIFVMNADGTGVEQLTENEYRDYDPAWAPLLK